MKYILFLMGVGCLIAFGRNIENDIIKYYLTWHYLFFGVFCLVVSYLAHLYPAKKL